MLEALIEAVNKFRKPSAKGKYTGQLRFAGPEGSCCPTQTKAFVNLLATPPLAGGPSYRLSVVYFFYLAILHFPGNQKIE